MITTETDQDGTTVKADGRTICIFTLETDAAAVSKFVDLAKSHDTELSNILQECDEKREWNFRSDGKGRNWPCFNAREHLVNRLCKQAGIRDS